MERRERRVREMMTEEKARTKSAAWLEVKQKKEGDA